MRSQVPAALASLAVLAGCASFQDSQITIPSDSLRPEFTAIANTAVFDALSDYELRYTVDGHEYIVGQDAIIRDGSLASPKLTYVVSKSVPPGSLITATWSARFLSGPQTSEIRARRTPEPLHDLQVNGVYLYVNEKPVIGDLAKKALDGETDHPLRFVLKAGVPVRIRAVVSNNSGTVAQTGIWLHFPDLPGQEQKLEKALGPGDAIVVVFDEVTPKRGKGVVVVNFGDDERPLDIDPSNDAFRTGVDVRS